MGKEIELMNNQARSSLYITPEPFNQITNDLKYWMNSGIDEVVNKDEMLKVMYNLNKVSDDFILFLEELDEESED